jgi:hypothetical protein
VRPAARWHTPHAGGVSVPDDSLQLNTAVVPPAFFASATHAGITVYEPFGGLCAGLEAALRAGFKVRRYIYADVAPVAQKVARFRLQKLAALYPSQLTPAACAGAFTTLPQDIYATTPEVISAVARQTPEPWLVVAGWECQDLSSAGGGAGLEGARSRSLFQLVRVLRALQLEQTACPPAFLIENTSFQLHPDARIRQQFTQVCRILGPAVLLDAVRFGSYAHRLRNFWTNLLPPAVLGAVSLQVQRPPGMLVQTTLDSGRTVGLAKGRERLPWHQCNVPGQPLSALPTLVSRHRSYAFRPEGRGAVFDTNTQQWDEPNADERERAMGYATSSTAAPGVSEARRREVLGRCMDANCLQSILAIGMAWGATRQGSPLAVHSASLSLSPSPSLSQAYRQGPTDRPGEATGSRRGQEVPERLTNATVPVSGGATSQAVGFSPGQADSHTHLQPQRPSPWHGQGTRSVFTCGATHGSVASCAGSCGQGSNSATLSDSPSCSYDASPRAANHCCDEGRGGPPPA